MNTATLLWFLPTIIVFFFAYKLFHAFMKDQFIDAVFASMFALLAAAVFGGAWLGGTILFSSYNQKKEFDLQPYTPVFFLGSKSTDKSPFYYFRVEGYKDMFHIPQADSKIVKTDDPPQAICTRTALRWPSEFTGSFTSPTLAQRCTFYVPTTATIELH